MKNSSLRLNQATLHLDRTGFLAPGTELRFPQLLCLASRRFLQNSCRQSLHCRVRDLLHLREINVQPRTVFSEALSNDYFSPLLGQSADRLQFFPCELPCRHAIVILDLKGITRIEFQLPILREGLWRAKDVLHSLSPKVAEVDCTMLEVVVDVPSPL